jgi:hypothetical protein
MNLPVVAAVIVMEIMLTNDDDNMEKLLQMVHMKPPGTTSVASQHMHQPA